MTDQPATLRTEVLAHTTHLLADGSIMTARDIAAALVKGGLVGVDKRLVNSVLTIEGKGRFSYDRTTYTNSSRRECIIRRGADLSRPSVLHQHQSKLVLHLRVG